MQADNRYGKHYGYALEQEREVSIRVVIEAKARNDEKAQAIIDRVNIRMEKMGNTVSAVAKPEVAKRKMEAQRILPPSTTMSICRLNRRAT